MRIIDKIDQLINRLDQNLSDYTDHLMGFDRQQIIDMAGRISAMHDAHFYLTEHHAFDYEQAEYLLQFQNPLEVVADAWQKRTEDISDMSFALDEVFDKQDSLLDYPLVTDTPQQSAYLQKFQDVDVLATLKAIAAQSIIHHPKDMDIDVEFIRRYAVGDDPEKKMLLWHVSAYGTHHLFERDTFVVGTRDNNCWLNYTYPDMLGYAVEITGMENGKVKGNVYELDHKEHMAHVRRAALPAQTVTISYEDGRDTTVSRREYDDDRHRLMSESGNVTDLRFHPEDESVLAAVLRREQRHREETPKGNFKTHMKKLADNRVQAEAERIVTKFKEKNEPDSPGKTHFIVPLSSDFQFLASSKDLESLFDALPYKTKTITALKGEKGLFATVAKDELQKSSVRARLAQATKEVASRPAQDNSRKSVRDEKSSR